MKPKKRVFVSWFYAIHLLLGALSPRIEIVLAALTAIPAPGPATADEATPETRPVSYAIKVLRVPGASATAATSANNRGQVAGWYKDGQGVDHGFIYDRGTFRTLDVPGQLIGIEPLRINDNGQVVGIYFAEAADDGRGVPSHAFLYSDGAFTTWDAPGARDTQFTDINDSGQIAGYYSDAAGAHGFIYDRGSVQSWVLPGARPHASSVNLRINASGTVAGSYEAKGGERAFVYDHGKFTRIDMLEADGIPSITGISVSGINSRGQVSGTFSFRNNWEKFVYRRGFLLQNDVVSPFEGLPFNHISFISAINDGGQILGGNVLVPGGKSDPAYFVYSNGVYSLLGGIYGGDGIGIWDFNNNGQLTGACLCNTLLGAYGFVATPPIEVLDEFTRTGTAPGPTWNGATQTSEYQLLDHRLAVHSGGFLYWQPNTFGPDQEAFVTLTQVPPGPARPGVLLKVQGQTGDYRQGAVAVRYDGLEQTVSVAIWRKGRAAWRNYRPVPVAFTNGDRLGARISASGSVRIYRNAEPVGTVRLSTADRQFFDNKPGHIGLWFEDATGAVLDDFGGGTHMR